MKTTGIKVGIKALFVGAALFFVACGQDTATTEEETTTTTTTDETMTDMRDEGQMRDTMGAGMKGGMMGHMHQHMQDMQQMRSQMTGDPDYDFALMMTQHHQGAIRMAEEEVANGTDNQLKDIANRTIKTNKEDIQKLQDFTKTHKPTSGDTAATMRMMQPMRKMMGGMGQGRMGMGMDMEMDTTNMDRNFATMMIRHHQMGNEMSSEFLKMAKTPAMKQMAQKMMDEQQKELKELQAWQQQNKQ